MGVRRRSIDERDDAKGDAPGEAVRKGGVAHRSRWAVVGAVVAVLSGAGGLSSSSYAVVASGERTVYVPISPCRLLDTRSGADNIGGRATPLGADETFTTPVRGSNGACSIPVGAVGVGANVTIDHPTAASYLTIRPADAPLATSSNLNWIAGQAPTPNAVTTKLSADGRISIYNHNGTVDVIIDIVGYYEDHNFDDRYYTKSQVDGQIGTLQASVAALQTSEASTQTGLAALTAKSGHEVVVSAGLSQPDPLSPTFHPASLDETITTTTSGHWLVTKSFVGELTCGGSAGALYYILIDNVPVRSSVILRPRTLVSQYDDALIGMTPDVIPAGTHVIGIGAECPAAFPGGNSGWATVSISAVTVMS